MMEKIIGAFTFRKEVYQEVEKDATFTPTAWMIVAVVAFLSQLGTHAATAQVVGGRWVMGAIGGTIFAVVGFAFGAFVIAWAGKTFFNADTSFEEMVRVLGLAYVWNVIGFLGILGLLGKAMTCITGPIALVAGIAGLVAWFIAAKEALDLEWPQTIGTVIIGWVVSLIISIIAGAILGLFGLAGAGVGAALRGLGG
ncbi:MAG: YIP1 family protein [Anaerolineaceae bacterium]|nr:YIP1 family protein [Anaerolineaceae bacterium]